MSSDQYEHTLLARAKEGDEEATSRLVSANMGLVRSVCARFRSRGTEYEDLVQIGSIGMLKAIRSFEPSFGTAFSTYAVPLIVGEIRRHLRDDGPIKVGRALKKQGSDLLRVREAILCETGREPTVSELAERCELSEAEAAFALEAVTPLRSLSEPKGEDEGLTLESTLAERSGEIERLTDRLALRQALNTLEPTERMLVILRYFRGFSQQKTGQVLGMTQVRVSRTEKRVMDKLRKIL